MVLVHRKTLAYIILSHFLSENHFILFRNSSMAYHSLFQIFLVLSSLFFSCTHSLAQATRKTTVKATYGFSFAGFPAGNVSAEASFSDDATYSIDATAKLTGLAGWFFDGEGTLHSSGSIKDGTFVPSVYHAKGLIEKKPSELKFTFQDGNVVAVSGGGKNESVDYIPFEKRRAVIDTLSSILLPALPDKEIYSPENCKRTVHVIGEFWRDLIVRSDSTFAHLSTMYSTLNTFKEKVLVCSMETKVTALYNASSPISFNPIMLHDEFWFYPLEEARILFPVRIKFARPGGVLTLNLHTLNYAVNKF